ncbi:MAG: phenylalanine--tRNA ligase subunit beta [Clostridia bacterium]|nr:phenylalanine--tRNA ligase subunit beta [Clostridia bacterium]
MKAPMKWLNEYTKINMPAEEYARRMIMTGTAVEGWENTAKFTNVVVGYVKTCEMHPDSDHLHVCTVDVGAENDLQIVCGAPNVHAGAYVCCALEGAELPGGVKIKHGKIRGVESFGMLCSGPELDVPSDLYPHCGEEGIILLKEEVKPGTDVCEIFGLGDDVIEYEILANRPDCLSVWGVARESATVLGEHFVMPEIAYNEKGKGKFDDYAKVIVEDEVNCPRYCARVITNVKIGPSPKWMREYLHGAGVRSINNIVDITNFVMLETGHPMHAFDLSKVREQTIVVRRAHEGEELTTLDGKTHKLTGEMLVIADKEKATGLAGIMGGEESEIVNDTASVLFECAAFERGNNRVTARSLGIRTESSGRFEKGVCAETAMQALDRACMLVEMLNCGDIVPGAYDNYPNPKEKKIVKASCERIRRRIGVNVDVEKMEDILLSLNIETELDGDTLTCEIPAYRVDIEGEADLSEEILRLYGYDAIPSTLMNGVTMAGKRHEAQSFNAGVKRALVGMGYFETQSFSFVSPKWIEKLNLSEGDPRLNTVVIRNPLGEDTSVMRTTLVPSMLNSLSLNMNRGNADAKLMEISPVFMPAENDGELPKEVPTLLIAMYGNGADFFTLKETVLCLLERYGLKPYVSAGGDNYYHPGRKALLTLRGGSVKLGQMGEIHPDVAEAFDMTARAYVAEIDITALKNCQLPIPAVKPLPKYQAVSRDIALVADEAVPAGDLMAAIEKAAGKLCEGVKLFDVYRGERLGEGKKSLAFSIIFRSPDHTLTEQEITSAMDKILKTSEKNFGAVIRA